MWASLEFYKETYLKGDSPLIPDTSYPRWEQQARNTINWRNVEVVEISDKLKMCTCAVAELLYKQHLSQLITVSSDGSVQLPVNGYSNDGFSVNYLDILKNYRDMPKALFHKEVKDTILEYLQFTEYHQAFVFRGM